MKVINNLTRISLTFLLINFFAHESLAQEESEKWLELDAVYSALPWVNVYGGEKTRFVYIDNADLTAKIDFDQIFNLRDDLSVFVYALGNHGDQATNLMGDFQVASNIEAPKAWRLFEFWVQRNVLNDRISFLAGLYDLNSEFDVLQPGVLFINSSFGIGAEYAQSGISGPSIFPISSLGIRLSSFVGNRTSFKLAILDAVPGTPNDLTSNQVSLSKRQGALIAGELTIYTGHAFDADTHGSTERSYVTRRRKVGRAFGSLRNDKVNAGMWYYTSDFQYVDNASRRGDGNYGVYVGFQKYFEFNESNYFAFFGRYGVANPKYNRLGSALSGGLVWSSSIFKIEDEFGLAFSSGFNGRNFQEFQPGNETTETVVEFTYSLPIKSWILLQPDVQYVINPSTREELRNPLSVAMLVQISVGL